MKLRTVMKIAVSSSVILMCAGLALYFFFRLSAAKEQKEINLFELVPSTASAVFATDDMVQFVAEIEDLSCSKDQHYLRVSKLFSCLKQAFSRFSEDSPHGLSRQMKRLLISFHEPDHALNQVFYFPLGSGDRQLIDRFREKYVSSSYVPKEFVYQGEKIMIYPMEDGHFLASYLTADYMVLSFQKKLIEEVIDAYKKEQSLADEKSFMEVCTSPRHRSLATIYARANGLMGWSEFDMDMKDDFIYFTGFCHDTDSCSFVNQLLRQESVDELPSHLLPATTFYFSQQRLDDWNAFLLCGGMGHYASVDCGAEVWQSDRELSRYLVEHTKGDLLLGLFHSSDTAACHPEAVLALSVRQMREAEKSIWPLVNSGAAGHRGRQSRVSFCHTSRRTYPVYRLPQTTLFPQLTGLDIPSSCLYAVFYKQYLLLSSKEESLFDYIRQVEKGEVFDGTIAHQTGLAALSETYRFMVMADLGHLLDGSESGVRYLPDFFQNNADFFRRFILFAQFTCVEGTVCPHIVLRYQAD